MVVAAPVVQTQAMTEAYVLETDDGDDADFLRNILGRVIDPEITRRKADGRLPTDFVLNKAQLILEAESDALIVRLNEEVKVNLLFELEYMLESGSPRFQFLLTESDSNAAHVTLVRLGQQEGWYISTDARFNATRVAELGTAAKEFLETGRDALALQRFRAFVDNLNSAVELMAKAYVLLRADRETLASRTHGLISARFNRLRKEGVADASHTELHNSLTQLRRRARYLETIFVLSEPEAERMLAVADDMYELLLAVTPWRARVEPEAPGTTEEVEAGRD
jgi:hypothetical protein